jgi:2-iminobutanoate/2-iminopropanoate deaminase
LSGNHLVLKSRSDESGFFYLRIACNLKSLSFNKNMPKEIIFSEKAPAPIGPYSQAVKVNNTLYVSGQIAFEASQLGNIKIEAGAVMENIGHILKAAGFGFENVVKSNIFLKDMNDFAVVNEVYGQFFTSEPPARETVQVARLPKDVNVEISVIAVEL